MIRGRPKADGLALQEILHASFIGEPVIRAKFAFIVSKTGSTAGSFEHSTWSKETLKKVAAAREAMERDAAKVCMSGVSDEETPGGLSGSAPKGLVESLDDSEVPSV
jgi:hypothetical protein